jgi:Short C-terminal domain
VSLRWVLANAIGLATCAALGWGVHGLILIGECGEYPNPPCPPESVPYFLAVGAGVPGAIIAAVMGGRLAIAGVFVAPGIAMAWAGLDQPAGQRVPLLLFGGLLSAGPVLLLAVILLVQARKARLTGELIASGGEAIGTVSGIRDTGVTINKNPRVVLTLRIEPLDGSPSFDGTKTLTVSRVDMPYPGKRFPVWFDRANRHRFFLGTHVGPDAPAAVRRLFAVAQAAADPLDRLARLNELRLAGALTQVEFDAQKARLLQQ